MSDKEKLEQINFLLQKAEECFEGNKDLQRIKAEVSENVISFSEKSTIYEIRDQLDAGDFSDIFQKLMLGEIEKSLLLIAPKEETRNMLIPWISVIVYVRFTEKLSQEIYNEAQA